MVHREKCIFAAEPVAAALEANPNVSTFVLRGNTLGIEAGERIAQALEGCPMLKVILFLLELLNNVHR